ncbi:hypothetical protein QNN00_13095 [Bacillus velezensis]|nr:hypothetical protein [Bacillus velezensis]
MNKTAKAWPSLPGKNRMGAVSAFGMSGTNAHVVMESYKRALHLIRMPLHIY